MGISAGLRRSLGPLLASWPGVWLRGSGTGGSSSVSSESWYISGLSPGEPMRLDLDESFVLMAGGFIDARFDLLASAMVA